MSWLSIPKNLLFFGDFKTEENPDVVPYSVVGLGLGLGVTVYDGWLRNWHDGYVPPFAALMNLYPDLRLGISRQAAALDLMGELHLSSK